MMKRNPYPSKVNKNDTALNQKIEGNYNKIFCGNAILAKRLELKLKEVGIIPIIKN